MIPACVMLLGEPELRDALVRVAFRELGVSTMAAMSDSTLRAVLVVVCAELSARQVFAEAEAVR